MRGILKAITTIYDYYHMRSAANCYLYAPISG